MNGHEVAVALTVGTDALLLHTRNEILRHAGIAVVSAASVEAAFVTFLAGDFDFVVLCHSLAQRERKRLTALIRRHGASTPIITVADLFYSVDEFADLTTTNEPATMLSDISRVVRLALPDFASSDRRR